MGTSTSSNGGGPRSPFDPEWLDSPISGNVGDTAGNGGGDVDAGDSTAPDDGEPGQPLPPVNRARRLAGARIAMSSALGGGGSAYLTTAMKRMVGSGMGGSARAAKTMRATAQGAGALGWFLTQARNQTDPGIVNWVQRVRTADLSANDLILAVVKEVISNTGSIDEDSLRNAATETFSMLYETSPDIDIFNLTDQQIADVIGFTVANDICNRVDLLLGQRYEKLKYTPQQVQLYRRDVREFIHGKVRVELDRLGPKQLDSHGLASEVLAATLEVFCE